MIADMTTPTIEAKPVLTRNFLLGEGPLWDERRECLFFVDIDAGEAFRYVPGEPEARLIYSGPKVGGMTLEEDGRLVLFREDDLAALDPETGRLESRPAPDDPERSRFNDAIALPDGSVLVGVIAKPGATGRLWRFSSNGSQPVPGCESSIGNGLALTRHADSVLWTDTPGRRLLRLGIGPNGELGEPEPAYSVPDRPEEGFPDGLTADSEGRLYSARWAGGSVVMLDPPGMGKAGRVVVATENVTSAAFGGPELSTLYVTTAGSTLYAAEFGRQGVPECRSRLYGSTGIRVRSS